MVLPFEEEYRKKYYKLLDEVFESNFWSDGKMTRMFEEKFEEYTGLPSCAVTSGGAGLLSIFEYIGVRGYDVIVPSSFILQNLRKPRKEVSKGIYTTALQRINML